MHFPGAWIDKQTASSITSKKTCWCVRSRSPNLPNRRLQKLMMRYLIPRDVAVLRLYIHFHDVCPMAENFCICPSPPQELAESDRTKDANMTLVQHGGNKPSISLTSSNIKTSD